MAECVRGCDIIYCRSDLYPREAMKRLLKRYALGRIVATTGMAMAMGVQIGDKTTQLAATRHALET